MRDAGRTACADPSAILCRPGENNTLTFETGEICHPCEVRERSQHLLPPRFNWVYYGDLHPAEEPEKVGISRQRQQLLIDQIKKGDLDGHSVMISGPSRAGKTVLTCALLTRMVDVYYMNVVRERAIDPKVQDFRNAAEPPIFRFSANQWLTQYHEWSTHSFDSWRARPEEPQPNQRSLRRYWNADFTPVLLLEEIDKFSVTDARINALFSVIDTVYESSGMIISTSNLTEVEIKKRLPSWFYHRLVESSKDGKIRLIDLFKIAKRTKSTG